MIILPILNFFYFDSYVTYFFWLALVFGWIFTLCWRMK